MRNRSKLMLAGLTAACVLGALVSAATANRIAINNTNNQWRATWNAVSYIGAAGFANIECHLTIEGSFHSKTLSKALEQLIGYVTKAIVDETHCTGGSARALTETLPWHIRYRGFTGTLPKIETIEAALVGDSFAVQALIFGTPVRCLFTSTASSPIKGFVTVNTANGVAESLTPEAAPIPKTSGEGTCGESGRVERTSTALTQEATATKITLTLVQ